MKPCLELGPATFLVTLRGIRCRGIASTRGAGKEMVLKHVARGFNMFLHNDEKNYLSRLESAILACE